MLMAGGEGGKFLQKMERGRGGRGCWLGWWPPPAPAAPDRQLQEELRLGFGGDRHSPGGSGQLRPVGRATSKQPGGGPGAKLRGTGRQKKGEKKGKKGGRRRGCCFKLQAWEQVEGKVQKRREDVSFHLMLQEIDWNVLWQQQSPVDMSNSFNTIQTIELGNIDLVKFCFFTSS